LTTDAGTLAERLAADAVVVIDLGPSPSFRRGHIPGAWFTIRASLVRALETLPTGKPFVLTSPDGVLAAFAADEFGALTGEKPLVLTGGTSAWTAAGLPLETGFERATDAPIDVYRRPYEGTDHARAAMQAYLDWEFGLVDQLERDGSHGFFVI
jgi:rhodanese-related sulfurtransferase